MNPGNYRHGHSKTRTYRIWKAMNARCKSHKDYFGRGIMVCDRWKSFENFLADMGECPLGLTIDRFPDNDGHYEPNNCRWATRTEQRANQRPPSCSACGSFEHDIRRCQETL